MKVRVDGGYIKSLRNDTIWFHSGGFICDTYDHEMFGFSVKSSDFYGFQDSLIAISTGSVSLTGADQP